MLVSSLFDDILGPEVIHYVLVLVHAVGPVVEVQLAAWLRSVVLLAYDDPAPLHEVALGAAILSELMLSRSGSAFQLRSNCRLALHLYLLLNLTNYFN